MIYVGETIRVTTSVETLDRSGYLTPNEVNLATVEFFDEDGDLVVWTDLEGVERTGPQGMGFNQDWNPPSWFYDWTPLDIDAGTYIAKVLLGGEDFQTYEYRSITIRRAPFNVPGKC